MAKCTGAELRPLFFAALVPKFGGALLALTVACSTPKAAISGAAADAAMAAAFKCCGCRHTRVRHTRPVRKGGDCSRLTVNTDFHISLGRTP